MSWSQAEPLDPSRQEEADSGYDLAGWVRGAPLIETERMQSGVRRNEGSFLGLLERCAASDGSRTWVWISDPVLRVSCSFLFPVQSAF